MSEDLGVLTVEDAMDVAEVIESVMGDLSEDDIASLLGGASDPSARKKAGMLAFRLVLKHGRGKVFSILSRASGIEESEFKGMPIKTLLDTVKSIRNNPVNSDFFDTVLPMLSK